MKKLLVFCAAALMLAACSTSKQASTSKIAEPMYSQLVADLNIQSNKVMGTYKFECKKNAIVDEKALMANAVYEALYPLKADVLVAPQYQVKTEIRGKKYITVTVKGYPAYYVNMRAASTVTSFDVQQLDGDKSYMITSKDAQGVSLGYRVVVPVDKDIHTISMDDATLDQLGVGENGVIIEHPAEEKGTGIFARMAAKIQAKKEARQNK